MQQGQVFKRNGSWYVRFYRDEIQDGAPVRRRVCEKLARYGDDYRSKKDVLPLVADLLSPVNDGSQQPGSSLTIAEFIEHRYLPAREKKLRPSTMEDYRDIFKLHVKARLGEVRLREFHTRTGQHFFDKLADDLPELSHQRLLRIKAFLSGLFTYAR
jgi:hypothetical protein